MSGSRRTPGSRPAGARPAAARPDGGSSATRRSTGPSTRRSPRDGRARGDARPRAGVETPRSTSDSGGSGRSGGSAAGSRTGTGPGGPGRGRPSVTGRAAVLALVVAVLLVSYAYPLRTWWDQHSQQQDLEAESEQLRQEKERLEREVALWDDPAVVAAQAGGRIGFVMPGEQCYVVIPADEDPPAQTVDGLPPSGSGEWYERLWSSVEAADAEAPTADESEGSRSRRTATGGDDES